MMYSTYGKICGLHIGARRIVTVTVAWFRIVVLPYARMICQQWLHNALRTPCVHAHAALCRDATAWQHRCTCVCGAVRARRIWTHLGACTVFDWLNG
jgi:hypothetical protein